MIQRLLKKESIGSYLSAEQKPSAARKQWLGSHLIVSGNLQLDKGAQKAFTKSGASLLAIGVVKVSGHFKRGDMVSCSDTHGKILAHGLVNYSAKEATLLMGKSSKEINSTLVYVA